MVQVDVFWSFALGAGFAAAASRQIKKESQEREFKLLENKHFAKNLIYLSCLFAPSGLYLLWQFTGWETMYVFSGQNDLWAWLVVLFAITNVTQGILGFWWAAKLIRADKRYQANLLWIAGYFLMFLILVHGWDGTGYRRFFTRTVDEWRAGEDTFWVWMALRWLVCPVALTLYAMGVIMLPLLFHWLSDWIKEGYELGDVTDPGRARSQTRGYIAKIILRITFVHTLGSAIAMSVILMICRGLLGELWGWLVGAAISLVLIKLIMLGPEGKITRDLERIALVKMFP